ncbi:MAG: hypothetical protein Q9M13_04160 [Mariprofundales bacterium]|nr:hypothetical protein [Mariprofundales bacterium]
MTKSSSITMLLLLLFTVLHYTAQAAEESRAEYWSIHHLPITEAQALVRSALSTHGTIAALPSQRLLIVKDDQQHLRAAKELLQRFDRLPDQYRITVEVVESEQLADSELQAGAQLPGGWVELQAAKRSSLYSGNQRWSLLLLAGSEGSFSVGEIQPHRQRIEEWLAGYGVIERESVNLIAITSGFFVRTRSIDSQQVEVELTPWLARSQPGTPTDAKPELLIGLGSAGSINQAPTTADSPLRLNAAPQLTTPKPVRIAHAATHLVLNIGESVELAASSGESQLLATSLLARHSSSGEQSLILRLTVERMP